jgi:hypothetical protein
MSYLFYVQSMNDVKNTKDHNYALTYAYRGPG